MHIDIIFNVSISMTMTDAVKCEMRNYQNPDNSWLNARDMNVVRLFSLGATTDAKDYRQNFNLFEAKVNPARHSYCVYNHAVHKQVHKLT